MQRAVFTFDTASPEYRLLESLFSSVVFHRKEEEYINLGFTCSGESTIPYTFYRHMVLLCIQVRSSREEYGWKIVRMSRESLEYRFMMKVIYDLLDRLSDPEMGQAVANLIGRCDGQTIMDEGKSLLAMVRFPLIYEKTFEDSELFVFLKGIGYLAGSSALLGLIFICTFETQRLLSLDGAGWFFFLMFPVTFAISAAGILPYFAARAIRDSIIERKYRY